jgi:uncharacterized membrane-anchored protein YhcB (DUF1043 family)
MAGRITDELRLMIRWLGRAWPLLLILVFIAFRQWAMGYVSAPNVTLANKVVGFILQTVGGGLVLWSVNENLGMVGRRSFLSLFRGWLREFPPIRRIGVNSGVGIGMVGNVTMSGRMSYKKITTTVEGRLEELQRQLDELGEFTREDFAKTNRRIDEFLTDYSRFSASQEEKHAATSARFEKLAVGSFKQQIFGALLAIYGAWISIFT